MEAIFCWLVGLVGWLVYTMVLTGVQCCFGPIDFHCKDQNIL